tara:strand:+ start:17980 stop:19185 length:1206 start_codon:yes stop_codon:yes gene_type:complete
MKQKVSTILAPLLCLAACGGSDTSGETPPTAIPAPAPSPAPTPTPTPSQGEGFTTTAVATFDTPWAMTFIGNGPYALITERGGNMFVVNTATGAKSAVSGVPTPVVGGQGGLGDIVMAPDSDPSDNSYPVYLSWAEDGGGNTRGAVVARGTFTFNQGTGGNAAISALSIIWRQEPTVTGTGHFSHRIAVAPDRQHIFITSGDRQKESPAQDMAVNLGKVIRLKPDGSVPADNPFASQSGVTAQIWSLGHRNLLGIAFDASGRLWEAEMGPRGGDEVNLIQRGANYGWPEASNGSHYSGEDIPDHTAGDGFTAPAVWWTPSISPGSLTYYNADLFPHWRNSLFVGALSGQALIRLQINGDQLSKADQWPMQRIREVETGPDGALWLLEDGAGARLLKLTPSG